MTSTDDRATDALVNVGPAIARRFAEIGIERIGQLRGTDADELFARMEHHLGRALDPCLLDTVRSAVDQADGKPARHWSVYSRERLARDD